MILAGTAVTIGLDGGQLFSRANNAVTQWNSKVAEEENKINEVWDILDSMSGGNEGESNPTKTLNSIAITTEPTKTSYIAGEVLDLTGIVVIATYSDESTSVVTASVTFSPENNSTLSTTGNATITASYTEGGVTRTATTIIAVATATEWEFATGGDKDSSGTVTVGDLIKPKIAAVASEQFYVIDDTDATSLTLLAEKNVKTNDATPANNIQSSSANTVSFRNNYNASNATEYAASDIKGLVNTYVNKLTTAGLALEDVETAEGGNPVTGVKGRLMWGTNSSGEVKSLLDAGLSDLVYGPSGAKLSYWLGTPYSGEVWYVYGVSSYMSYESVYVNSYFGMRPVIKILKSKI